MGNTPEPRRWMHREGKLVQGHAFERVLLAAPMPSRWPPADRWIEATAGIRPDQGFMVVSPAMATRLKLTHEGEAHVSRTDKPDFHTSRTHVLWDFPLELPASLCNEARAIIDDIHPGIDVVLSAEQLKHVKFEKDLAASTWRLSFYGWPKQLNTIIVPPASLTSGH